MKTAPPPWSAALEGKTPATLAPVSNTIRTLTGVVLIPLDAKAKMWDVAPAPHPVPRVMEIVMTTLIARETLSVVLIIVSKYRDGMERRTTVVNKLYFFCDFSAQPANPES